ncbi:MAG: ThiF family adenylyltransferase [Candidatus Thorarchaeota archaeon]|jgi:molybdopterin/thiamine biosynthesis adenylyltransferase
MSPVHLTRQSDLIPAEVLQTKINVVGAGAIGSFATLALAKMGFDTITVFDDDVVDDMNMNCQFFRLSDIGSTKVGALRSLVKDFTDTDIRPSNQRILSHFALSGVVISAVDSMQARKDIFQAAQAGKARYLIDPRMGAEYARLNTVDLKSEDERKIYQSTLYSDREAAQERCTARSTIYTVNMLAGYVAKVVKNLACEQAFPAEVHWSIKNDDMLVVKPA